MNKHLKRPTQENKILNLLKKRAKKGVKVYELIAPQPTGLGIVQYNARIYSLRRKGYSILNIKPGHFILETYA